MDVLSAGAYFNSRTINSDQLLHVRTLSAMTIMNTELLRIDREDFFKVGTKTCIKSFYSTNSRFSYESILQLTSSVDNDQLQLMRNQIKSLNLLGLSAFPDVVATFAPCFRILRFEASDSIIKEGDEIINIYWIIKGTCKLSKNIQFVKKSTHAIRDETRVTYRIHNVNTPLNEDEELKQETIQYQDLNVGDYFPDIPSDSNINWELTVDQHFKKLDYLNFLGATLPTEETGKSFANVVATTKVDVLCISLFDLAKIIPDAILLKTIKDQKGSLVTKAKLEELYMQNIQWKIYKKQVRKEMKI